MFLIHSEGSLSLSFCVCPSVPKGLPGVGLQGPAGTKGEQGDRVSVICKCVKDNKQPAMLQRGHVTP